MRRPARVAERAARRVAVRAGVRRRRLALALALAASVCAPAAGQAHVLGVHVHDPAVAAGLKGGFGAYRLWDTGTAWRRLEPQRGTWDFTRLDAFVELGARQGRPLLLTLGSTPEWASSRPDEPCAYGKGCAAPPASLDDWRRYVDVVSRRYRGRIECYELWNEVRFQQGEDPRDRGGAAMFYSGRNVDLVALARVAAEVIRANDPQACLLAPSFHVYGDWIRNLDRFLSGGGAGLVDGISFHFYADRPEGSVGALREVGRTLARHRMQDARLWNTEFGFESAVFDGPDVSPDQALRRLAALIARSAILGAAAGVTRSYWYAYDNRRMGWPHRDGEPAAAFGAALQTVSDALREHDFSACAAWQGQVWRCTVRAADGRRGVALWSAARDFSPACAEGAAPAGEARPVGLHDRFEVRAGRTCVGAAPMLLLQAAGRESERPGSRP